MRQIVASTIGKALLGKNGENGATQVLFRAMTGLSGSLIVTRAGDTQPSPRVTDVVGNYLVWTVNSWDTNVIGDVSAEMDYTDSSGTVVKSVTYAFEVVESLGEPSEIIPDPYDDWYADILAASQNAKTAAAGAEAAETTALAAKAAASTSESNAKSYANAAGESAMSAAGSADAASGSAAAAAADAMKTDADVIEANDAKNTAETAASAAAGSADYANESASAAALSATDSAASAATANELAAEARNSAESAGNSASEAVTKAHEAAASASTAAEYADSAKSSVKTSKEARDAALAAQTAAETAATKASNSQSAAYASASAASTSEKNAAESEKNAENAEVSASSSAKSIKASAEQIAENATDIANLNAELDVVETIGEFNKTSIDVGTTVNGYIKNGIRTEASGYFKITGYIDISAYKILFLTCRTYNNYSFYAFYDADYNVVSYVDNTTGAAERLTDQKVFVPDGAVYICICETDSYYLYLGYPSLFDIPALEEEIKRAEAAEAQLNDDLADEVTRAKAAEDSKVSDVQINGTTIVTDGVANVPVATSTSVGLVKANSSNASGIASDGSLYPSVLTASRYGTYSDWVFISKGTLNNILATPSIMPSLTSDEQMAAQSRIGLASGKDWVLKGTISGTEDDRGNIDTGVSVDLTGCTELKFTAYGKATANTSLDANVGHLVYGVFNASRCMCYALFQDSSLGFDNYICKVSNYATSSNVADNGSGYCYFTGKHISNLYKMFFSDPSVVTSCTVEIYAR